MELDDAVYAEVSALCKKGDGLVRVWAALRQWVSKRAVKVPRRGLENSMPAEIWAMRDALEMFSKGIPGATNPP
jgi:hypothetical protein